MNRMIMMVLLIFSAPAPTATASEPEPRPEPSPEPESAALAAPFTPWTHIRALSPSATALIAEAAERSHIVASLMEQVQGSNVVVYVTDPAPWFLTDPASYMAILSEVAGTRYLLVRIARRGLSSSDRIVLLGHELRHALEVAAAPEVRDGGGLARLYGQIGWSRGRHRYESEAARSTADRIRRELAGDRSR